MKIPYTVSSYNEDTIFKLKTTTGHNSVNNVGQVLVLNFCTLPDHAFYLYHIFKISQRVSEVLSRHEKFTKGYNYIKNISIVMVLVLYTLSVNISYLHQVS